MDVLPTDEELLLQTFGNHDDEPLLQVTHSRMNSCILFLHYFAVSWSSKLLKNSHSPLAKSGQQPKSLPHVQQEFPASEPAKEAAFVSSAAPGTVFQDPFVDIPPMLCGAHPALDRDLTSLEFSPSDNDDFCTQTQQSQESSGRPFASNLDPNSCL